MTHGELAALLLLIFASLPGMTHKDTSVSIARIIMVLAIVYNTVLCVIDHIQPTINLG